MKKEGQVRVGLVLKAKAIDSTRGWGGGGCWGWHKCVHLCVCRGGGASNE